MIFFLFLQCRLKMILRRGSCMLDLGRKLYLRKLVATVIGRNDMALFITFQLYSKWTMKSTHTLKINVKLHYSNFMHSVYQFIFIHVCCWSWLFSLSCNSRSNPCTEPSHHSLILLHNRHSSPLYLFALFQTTSKILAFQYFNLDNGFSFVKLQG